MSDAAAKSTPSPPTAAPSSRRTPRWALVLLGLVLVLALYLRGARAGLGLPYLQHWDEPQIGNRALMMLKTGDFNPHFFNYGSLLIYLNVGVDVLHYFSRVTLPDDDPEHLESPRDIQVGTPDGFRWQVSHPSFYRWNRLLTAIFGAACVLLAFLIGRELEGWRSGLLAAALLALVPFHVEHSAYVTTDVPASALALGAVWLALRFLANGKPGWWVGSLVLVGLAASTKYNLAFCLLAPAGVLAFAAWRRHPGYRRWLWLALPAVPALAFLLGTPYALLDLPRFLADTGYEIRHYTIAGHGEMSIEPGWAHFWSDLRALVANLGMPAALLALLGLLAALRRRGAWVLLLPALQLWLTARTLVPFHRNVIFVYPFAAVLFGLGVVAGWELLLRRCGEGSRAGRALRWAVPGVLALWLGGSAVASSVYSARMSGRAESRSQAVAQLNTADAADAAATQGVAIAAELRLHPLDLDRLRLPYRVRPLLELLCARYPEPLALVPVAVSTSGPDPSAHLAYLGAALADAQRLGPPAGRGELYLDRCSINPAVQVIRPRSPGDPLPAVCGPALWLDLLTLAGGAHREGGALWLPLDASATTPFLRLPPGRHGFRFEVTAAAVEPPPRLRARALVHDAAALISPAAKSLRVRPGMAPPTLALELRDPTAVALVIEHLSSGGPKSADETPVQVTRVWLEPENEPAAEAEPAEERP